jgi:DNA-3-methyladenine glycosylase
MLPRAKFFESSRIRSLVGHAGKASLTSSRIGSTAIAKARANRGRIGRAFFDRSPEVVARQLLGKVLSHNYKGEWLSGRIIEVEAYLGLDDPAAHTFIGETQRNRVLFGPPGVAYVYLVYGIYYCLNVSCLPAGEPGGVLFRAIEPLEGVKTMAKLRGIPESSGASRISGGPGRLCQALGITRELHNGVDVTRRGSILRVVDDGYHVTSVDVTPRIGIQKAVDLPLRFLIASDRRALHGKAGTRRTRAT